MSPTPLKPVLVLPPPPPAPGLAPPPHPRRDRRQVRARGGGGEHHCKGLISPYSAQVKPPKSLQLLRMLPISNRMDAVLCSWLLCTYGRRFGHSWCHQLPGDPLSLRDVPSKIHLVPKGIARARGSPRRLRPDCFTVDAHFTGREENCSAGGGGGVTRKPILPTPPPSPWPP